MFFFRPTRRSSDRYQSITDLSSDAQTASEESVVWSCLFQFYVMLFPSRPKSLDLGRLNALPFELLREMLSYLPLPEQTMLRLHKRQPSSTIFKLNQLAMLNEAPLLDKFIYLIARAGENNQDKAEAILKQYPELVKKLTSAPQDVRDPTRNFIRPMSAYAYAYWAGDTRMRHMMEKYMDEDTKTIVYKQCLHIAEQGVDYELLAYGKIVPDSKVSNSRHFDFQPLIDAYKTYIAEVQRVRNTLNGEWIEADKLWLNIGIELTKVPIHVAQEYCSNQAFYPLNEYQEALKKPDFKRSVVFYQWGHRGMPVFWFSLALPHSGLGVLFSIYKPAKGAWGVLPGDVGRSIEAATSNLDAIVALCKARTDDDLKRTLDVLKPIDINCRLGQGPTYAINAF